MKALPWIIVIVVVVIAFYLNTQLKQCYKNVSLLAPTK